jgi:superfamily II DNA or RNA helicase
MASKKSTLRVIDGGNQKPSDQSSIIFTDDDIENNFEPEDVELGYILFEDNHICDVNLSPYQDGTQQITGTFKRRKGTKPYRIKLTAIVDKCDQDGESIIMLEGVCTCPDAMECRHAAALGFYAIAHYKHRAPKHLTLSAYDFLQEKSKKLSTKPSATHQLSQWFRAFNTHQKKQPALQKQLTEGIVYLLRLSVHATQPRLELALECATRLKRGGYGKSRDLLLHTDKAKSIITPKDKTILNELYALQDNPRFDQSIFSFLLKNCDDLLMNLLDSNKVYWQKTSKAVLQKGETKTIEPRWQVQTNGEQHIIFFSPGSERTSELILLPVSPLWYVDPKSHCMGKIDTKLPDETVIWLSQLPAVPPSQIQGVQQKLKQLMPTIDALPMLQKIEYAPTQESPLPKVILRLYGKEFKTNPYELASVLIKCIGNRHLFNQLNFDHGDVLPKISLALAECQFEYLGRLVRLSDPEDTVEYFENGQLHTITRHRDFERECVDELSKVGLTPAALNQKLLAYDSSLQFAFIINEEAEEEAIVAEQLSTLQSLASERGWTLVLDESFPARIIHEADEWYTNLEETQSGIDWFGMSLGVMVDGEKVNILPLLLKQIKTQFHNLDGKAIKALPDSTPCELQMDNGEYLKIPFPRIRNILLVLCELFEEKPLDEKGQLRLSRLKASLLPEIEKAVGKTRLRWFGQTKIKRFGKKMANFKGIKTVKPAKNFGATLRPYQQDGLNWLQFLREFELNGILADDMGLGKTVQTLAHLLVEKQAKRLARPSLLIAPTSLMTNWENETAKFAPNLKVLVLHGNKRHTHFDKIEEMDIIFTTYPLVLRDKEILLKYTYHYLILDEAHQIKNSKAKVTQIILQMDAKHRLCLTGTPMENHLGELWSLFHFILPGLLGTKPQFSRVFRTPIEKNNDAYRHKQLIQRIKPFMLRRRKDEVVEDLPQKTEIIRKVQLGQEQRDLYESIRLAMQKKVRKAVDANGIERSQIIILDALLKLRQICCAPSLLKLKQAKAVKQSAKLDDLIDFLPDMIEEGRRVLLFSSFTSMLSLIEKKLNQQKLAYVKLTGQTTDRKAPINQFQNKTVPLFLISLKAGGIGLNLTTADTVIHYDPWWNPAAEQQATDRAHRIGQKNPVFVYKIIAEGTVEERIIEMQNKKRKIIQSVLDRNGKSKFSLTQKELDSLFDPIE